MAGAGGLRAGRAIIELSLRARPIERQLRQFQARVQQISSRFTHAGTFGIAGGGFAGLRNLFVGSAATAMAAYPVKLAANIELASAQMSVFTGSTEIAKDTMLDLLKFSAVSAQAPEEMANQMRLLMTRGILAPDALQYIKSIAVLAAGSTEEFEQLAKAFSDVANATRLNGEEMRQFKNTAFNPFIEIAKRTGETMDQLKQRMEAGGISFSEVAAAMQASVREGGLFHGMLEKIAGTLIGQFRMALAQLKLAILPIGEEMLVPLKEFMRGVNQAIPLIAEWIKAHKDLVKTAFRVGVTVAAAATGFVALGLALGLLGIVIGGIAFLFSSLWPFLLAGGAIAAAWWLLPELFSNIASVLGSTLEPIITMLIVKFEQLSKAAMVMAKGIFHALRIGDIETAVKILSLGLTTMWRAVTAQFESLWIQASTMLKIVWVGLMSDLKIAWTKLILYIKESLYDFVFNYLGPIMDKFGFEGLRTKLQMSLFDPIADPAAAKKRIDEIEAMRTAAIGLLQTLEMGNQAILKWELDAAMDALSKAMGDAKKLADAAKGAAQDFGLGALAPAILAAADAGGKGDKAKPQSSFDVRMAQQMFGGSGVFERQLAVQQKIEGNTRKQNGGIGFV